MFQASQVTMILGKPRIYVNGGFEIAQKGTRAWRYQYIFGNKGRRKHRKLLAITLKQIENIF